MTKENKIKQILEELVGRTTKTLYEGMPDKDVWGIDTALAQIKSEMIGAVSEEKVCFDHENKDTDTCNYCDRYTFFNLCRTETLARIELKFKEE